MPLIKIQLEQQIYAAFKKMQTNAKDFESAQRELAKDLATAIDLYIKSATIIIPPGQQSAGQNLPGQSVITAGPVGPLPGSTVTPGVVTATTTTPSPSAIIT